VISAFSSTTRSECFGGFLGPLIQQLSGEVMSKFRFDRLIEVKEKLIDRQQRQLEEALAHLDDIVSNIEGIQRDITAQYYTITSTSLTGNDFSVITEYIEYFDRKKDGLFAEQDRASREVGTIRGELYELNRELRMLENLKEKASRITHKADNRKEQKNLDQIALRLEERGV
jgi:flagellar export protein FliJ